MPINLQGWRAIESIVPGIRVRCRLRCWNCRAWYDVLGTLETGSPDTCIVVPDPPGWICPECKCGGTKDLVEVSAANEEKEG